MANFNFSHLLKLKNRVTNGPSQVRAPRVVLHSLSNIKYQNIISDMPQYYYQCSTEGSAWCVHAGEANA